MCENQKWKLLSLFYKLSPFQKLLETFGLNISNNSIFVTFFVFFLKIICFGQKYLFYLYIYIILIGYFCNIIKMIFLLKSYQTLMKGQIYDIKLSKSLLIKPSKLLLETGLVMSRAEPSRALNISS